MMTDSTIWVVDDDASIRWVLERTLQQAGYAPELFADAESALQQLATHAPDLVITDVRMPNMDGFVFMERLLRVNPRLPVIITTAHTDLDSAVSAYHHGAFEYLPKPFDVDAVIGMVKRALALQFKFENAGEAATKPADIIGAAPAMQNVFRIIGRLSKSDINVLISGESGTGKERVARALHRHSPRSAQPFIAINMAAIPESLLESELFGHEKGAFTGAQARYRGRFEQADGGTLFLDEIGDMPLEFQTRLLRVLAEGSFYRVGGSLAIQVNVRIIAATHQDLPARIKQGRFREDLYHRLNVIRIDIPPLRERQEDISLLMHYFLEKAARDAGNEAKKLSREAEQFLMQQSWPGNVRQLENLSRWLTVMAGGPVIQCEDLPQEYHRTISPSAPAEWEEALRIWAQHTLAQGDQLLLAQAQPRFEAALLKAVLEQTGGKKQAAAKLLGWGRNTLTRKLKTLGMED